MCSVLISFDGCACLLTPLGNFTSILVATILPCSIHMLFFRKTLSTTFKVVDITVIVVSFITMIVCTTVSRINLIRKLTG